jgi:EAL domain-containing protein (putative c-di-GMP-specific phosphodiesterase class I)
MAEIDTWLVEHAIAAVAKHQKERPELRFAFNLSASAFDRPDLADFVRATLDKHGVPPSSVIIEIAESVIVRHLSHVDTQIASLRKLGCEMALDDFGAGYSSLSCLQQLPMTYIKIDGSFIKDIVKNSLDQKMVRLIGEVGRESGMKTIAEYVQNGAAMSLLGKLGIDFAQGYYIGRPLVKPSTKSMPVTLSSKSRKRSARARA